MKTKEKMARAAYATFPNGGFERQPTTDTANRGEMVFIADPWEDAKDRHAQCFEIVDAVLDAMHGPGLEALCSGQSCIYIKRNEKAQGPHTYTSREELLDAWQTMLSTIKEEK